MTRRGTSAWALLVVLTALLGWSAAQTGDAFGDGTLVPPTSPRFADPAWYDLVDVRLLPLDTLTVEVTLSAVDPSGGLPIGITQPIVEVYLDAREGGAEALLPGSGLSMPLGSGWRWALRVTGDGAWGWAVDADGIPLVDEPVAIDVVVDGTQLTLWTPFPRPAETDFDVYAITGVYDPFRPDGWRPLARAPSPWAFSSETQVVPVVDVFPGDPDARAASLARGELPRAARERGFDAGLLPWLALMAAGVALALAGIWVRVLASRRRRALARAAAASAAATPTADPEAPGVGGTTWATLDPPPTAAPSADAGGDRPAADDGALLVVDGVGAPADEGPELIDDVDVASWPMPASGPPALPAPRSDADAADAAADGADGAPAEDRAARAQSPTDAAGDAASTGDGATDDTTEAPSDAKRSPKPS